MVEIFENSQAASLRAAEIFLSTAVDAVEKNGHFAVALTGGSSPEELYRLLAQPPYRDQVPWAYTYIFWGDERWVPSTHELSNAKMAFNTFLSKVPVPPEQIFTMWGQEPPEIFAQLYENQIKTFFGLGSPAFDLILLGMGDDGHTASLFPGTAVLEEKNKLVYAYYLEPQQMYRITLTAVCLNQAKKIIFMTFGERKAKALKEILEGELNYTTYPAQLIHPFSGEVIWLTDKEAAEKLSHKE